MTDLNTDPNTELRTDINTAWDFWYHSINNNNWTNDSYKLAYSITN